jgi:hypothetical protein
VKFIRDELNEQQRRGGGCNATHSNDVVASLWFCVDGVGVGCCVAVFFFSAKVDGVGVGCCVALWLSFSSSSKLLTCSRATLETGDDVDALRHAHGETVETRAGQHSVVG